MSELTHDVKKEVRIYTVIFGILLFLTIVTVAVSYLHLNVFLAVIVAMIVATVKASLVAGYFMHLLAEKKLIYFFLILTAIFFVALLFLPLLTSNDPLVGSKSLEPKAEVAASSQNYDSHGGGHH